MTNSDEEYIPVAKVVEPQQKKIDPLRALLNETMSQSVTGKKILEEEKQKNEAERLAKLPKEPEKLPSPKFKTVLKLRSRFPEYSKAYSGIGNDVYHTYDSFRVEIPNGPSK